MQRRLDSLDFCLKDYAFGALQNRPDNQNQAAIDQAIAQNAALMANMAIFQVAVPQVQQIPVVVAPQPAQGGQQQAQQVAGNAPVGAAGAILGAAAAVVAPIVPAAIQQPVMPQLDPVPAPIPHNYATTIVYLRNIFVTEGVPDVAFRKFCARDQQPGEDVSAFYYDLERLFRASSPENLYPEQMLMQKFINGLLPSYKAIMHLQRVANVREALEEARRLESRFAHDASTVNASVFDLGASISQNVNGFHVTAVQVNKGQSRNSSNLSLPLFAVDPDGGSDSCYVDDMQDQQIDDSYSDGYCNDDVCAMDGDTLGDIQSGEQIASIFMDQIKQYFEGNQSVNAVQIDKKVHRPNGKDNGKQQVQSLVTPEIATKILEEIGELKKQDQAKGKNDVVNDRFDELVKLVKEMRDEIQLQLPSKNNKIQSPHFRCLPCRSNDHSYRECRNRSFVIDDPEITVHYRIISFLRINNEGMMVIRRGSVILVQMIMVQCNNNRWRINRRVHRKFVSNNAIACRWGSIIMTTIDGVDFRSLFDTGAAITLIRENMLQLVNAPMVKTKSKENQLIISISESSVRSISQ